ncbi:tRNA dihydrouridine synthase DusB [Prochlorococcus marinus]|uniref:tRNA-dihydrouridine synthase n=1 Tax=Prochlorococcus marinus XMU1408 TaxID=2213228 RepID=A0A318R2V5_PROMR|nr:tRNA dihydrouridine synthase DusB [Prochlorococcus marinus]MBW3041407.1 tRNA dihydrouridine synthase DusB [Prochlorococcus marinus str. XMU1408]PYE02570.1 tRNA dihydrouridine synthase DusB [Prochlorococcus marinus XMU1408]
MKVLPPIFLSGNGTSRSLECPILQSPLAGVSDQIFRTFVRRWSPKALLFTEMVNAKSLELGHGKEKVIELSKESGPIGVQLFDHRPDSMIDAAIKAELSGAFLIDINMGCPVKKIARKGGGSALLKEPKLAQTIVKKVSQSISIPLTVKIRLGWCEDTSDPISFALGLQEAGAQLITVHGRTRRQGFSGNANWEAIAKIKKSLDIPVIANGDIKNSKDAIKCLEITNADGVMIGRASMGAPWLVGQIDEEIKNQKTFIAPDAKMKVSLSLEHLKLLVLKKGNHGLLIARKHMNWTCRGFQGASALRHKLVRASTPNEAIKLLEEELIKLN